jgi:DNA invertase Pin-like site-specific DNA recombinase
MDEARSICRQRDWEIFEYSETGSGSGRDLPERNRLLADARAGKLDVVLVWKFDRFARSTRDLLNALDSLREWGVDFVSITEGIDTSVPVGKLVFTIIAALAEFEKSLINERVAAGLDAARRRGTRLGRPTRPVDTGLARELLHRGLSMRATAKRMGVPARTLRRALEAGQKPVGEGEA